MKCSCGGRIVLVHHQWVCAECGLVDETPCFDNQNYLILAHGLFTRATSLYNSPYAYRGTLIGYKREKLPYKFHRLKHLQKMWEYGNRLTRLRSILHTFCSSHEIRDRDQHQTHIAHELKRKLSRTKNGTSLLFSLIYLELKDQFTLRDVEIWAKSHGHRWHMQQHVQNCLKYNLTNRRLSYEDYLPQLLAKFEDHPILEKRAANRPYTGAFIYALLQQPAPCRSLKGKAYHPRNMAAGIIFARGKYWGDKYYFTLSMKDVEAITGISVYKINNSYYYNLRVK